MKIFLSIKRRSRLTFTNEDLIKAVGDDKEPKSKRFDYGGSKVGTERWITVTKDDSPLHGRHLLIKKRADGLWTAIGGGGQNKNRQHMAHITFDMEKKTKTAEKRGEQRERKKELGKESREIRKEKRKASTEKRLILEKVLKRKGKRGEMTPQQKEKFLQEKERESRKAGATPEEAQAQAKAAAKGTERKMKQELRKEVRKLDKQLDLMLMANATGKSFEDIAREAGAGELVPKGKEAEPAPGGKVQEARQIETAGDLGAVKPEIAAKPMEKMDGEPQVEKIAAQEIGIKAQEQETDGLEGPEQDDLKLDDNGDPILKEDRKRELSPEQLAVLRERMNNMRAAKDAGMSFADYMQMKNFNAFESSDQAIENSHSDLSGQDRVYRDGENTQTYEAGDPGEISDATARKYGLIQMDIEEALKIKAQVQSQKDRLAEIRKIDKRLKQVETKGAKVIKELEGIEARVMGHDELLRKAQRKFYDKKQTEQNRQLYNEFNFAHLGETPEGDFKKKGLFTNPKVTANVQMGAYEALSGIQVELLGKPVLKKELMKGLGIQGATAVLSHVLMRDKTPAQLKALKGTFDKFIEKRHPEVVENTLKKAQFFDSTIKQLNEMRGKREAIKDSQGNVISQSLVMTGTAINRKINEAQQQKHLNTASAVGSLQTVAALRYLMDSGIKSGAIDVNVGRDTKAVRNTLRGLGLRAKDRGKTWNMKRSDVGIKLNVPLTSIKDFAGEVQGQQEGFEKLAKVKAGHEDKIGWLPAGFNKKFKAGGKSIKMDMSRDPKYKHQQTGIRSALASMDSKKGGGMLFNVEVGGGKTNMTYGTMAELDKREGVKHKKFFCVPKKASQQAENELHQFTNMKGKIVTSVRDLYNKKIDVKIITHEFYSKNIDAINKAGFHIGAIDEYDLLPEETRTKSRRDRDLKYRMALTGTPVGKRGVMDVYSIMQFVSNKNKELGTTRDFRDKYNELARGTTGWENSMVEGLKNHVAPYIFSAESKHDFKNKVETIKSSMSNRQKVRHSELNTKKKDERKAFNENASLKETPNKERKAGLDKIEEKYENLIERNILSGDLKHNGRLKATFSHLDNEIKRKKDTKALFHVNDPQARESLVRNLEKQYGKGSVRSMADTRGSAEEKGKQANRHLGSFRTDKKTRFLIIDKDSTAGINAQRADVAYFVQTPKTARDKIQAVGRHARTGREQYGDVKTVFMDQADYPVDSNRMISMKREEGLLGAIAGKGAGKRNLAKLAMPKKTMVPIIRKKAA